jgi:magnesium chelatase subunit D
VIALDEALEDEDRPPAALAERLAFEIDLRTLSHRDVDNRTEDVRLIVGARAALATVAVEDTLLDALTGTALALGIGSLRAPLLAYRTSRAAAALAVRIEVTAEDADLAARLVLAHRATSLPEGSKDDPPEGPEDEEAPPDDAKDDTPPPGTDDDANPAVGDRPLEDRLLEAALAALPKGLLDSLRLATGARPSARSEGKAGIVKKNGLRGRQAGVRPGKPGPGQRLSVIETLRAAAPLQTLRRRERPAPDAGPVPSRIEVRASDFRVVRQKQRSRTTAIFAVDASGSSALERLAEAKGAVELLLAECYVRRDQVALLAIRGEEATLLLPPTRSLLRAKRCLAGLPGGGGTPLAAGIEAALLLADAAARRGETPVLVFLTDGRANIARSGAPGRKQAAADALALANKARFAGYTALMIDISARPAGEAAVLAEAMAARYLPLPRADAGALSAIVTSALRP